MYSNSGYKPASSDSNVLRNSHVRLQISAADKSNAVSFRVAVGRHHNADQRVYDGLGWNKIVRVGKKSGAILSCLWTKVRGILRHVQDPLYFLAPLPDCLCQVVFRRYLPLSVEVVEKANKWKFHGPIFYLGDDLNSHHCDCLHFYFQVL